MSPPPWSQSVSQSPLTTLSLAQFPRLKRSRYPSPLPALSPPGKAESTLLSSSPKRNRRRFRRNSRYRCRYQRAEVHTVVTVVHAVGRVLTLLKQGKVLYILSPKQDTYHFTWPIYHPPIYLPISSAWVSVTGPPPLCLLIREREEGEPPNSCLFRDAL